MSQPTSSGTRSKRKRVNGNEMDVVPATRSTIWFDDGNIILEAEKSQFRVHNGVISRHSSVLKELFNDQHLEGEPTIEGCPVFRLTDGREDWENVLAVLYDSVKAYKSTDAISLSLLASMLRLGRKYQIAHLQAEAMERLRAEIPKNLDLWDKRYTKDGLSRKALHYHCFDLLNFVLEFGMESVLPVAYYACLDYHTLDDILRGTIRSDGTLVDISSTAKTTLVLGYQALYGAISRSVAWVSDNNLEGCKSPRICKARRAEIPKAVILSWHRLLLFSPSGWKTIYHTSLCVTCGTKMEENIQVSRQQVWEELPKYFGLPGWETLVDN